MRSTRHTWGRTVVGTALAATVAGAAVVGTGGPASSSPGGSAVAEVRAATAAFHDVDEATAAGYVPVSPCEQLPGVGAMGVHYLHPGLASDGVVDPKRPEVLLYLPKPGGGMRLVGVEWFVAEAATDGTAPTVLGRTFDGPMDGHGAGMPRHYDLHAWIWAHNPSGTFASWNPALSCGASS